MRVPFFLALYLSMEMAENRLEVSTAKVHEEGQVKEQSGNPDRYP